jgi:hypothetical protein
VVGNDAACLPGLVKLAVIRVRRHLIYRRAAYV